MPEDLLPNFFIRKATQTRNLPFTFDDRGFYKTLKRKVAEELEKLPEHPKNRSKYLTDALFSLYVTAFISAVRYRSFSVGILAGILLGLTAIAAHNFFHQKDNFRRFYFDFSMMSSREWRISHVLSHHMYTNTISDMEISSLEPFLWYLPAKRHFIVKYCSWLYSPVIYGVLTMVHFLKTLIQELLDGGSGLSFTILLPFTLPLLSWVITGQSALFCIVMFFWIIIVGSVHFGLVGVNAAHHHPQIFHDGDAIRPLNELDWGIHQLDAVMDRREITGSHFLVLTNFGDHALHHLFPSIDHGLLEYLYPIFLETCKHFGVEWKLTSQLELVKGQFLQLANEKVNSEPPKKLLHTKL
ncbi:cytochrome b5-related protein-like isoform X2 [Cylas formicarius]|nr:cytochrome b5-related protein-like isoform X2 [Cylas formicarius]